jgi:hypothetical protein
MTIHPHHLSKDLIQKMMNLRFNSFYNNFEFWEVIYEHNNCYLKNTNCFEFQMMTVKMNLILLISFYG